MACKSLFLEILFDVDEATVRKSFNLNEMYSYYTDLTTKCPEICLNFCKKFSHILEFYIYIKKLRQFDPIRLTFIRSLFSKAYVTC